MIAGMLSAGIDLRPALRTQRLMVQTALPEAMGSDNHLIRALEAMDSFKPDHLILDAISACVRMGSEHAAFDYLMRLVGVVKERGITCILTNQISRSGWATMRNSAASASPPWWTRSSNCASSMPARRSADRSLSLSPEARGTPIAASRSTLPTKASSSPTTCDSHRLGRDKPIRRTVENEQGAPSQAPSRGKDSAAITCSGCSWQAMGRIPKQALANLRRLCQEHLNGRCTIETVDVVKDFQAAVRDNILVTPALILVAPRPRVMVLGNLSDHAEGPCCSPAVGK